MGWRQNAVVASLVVIRAGAGFTGLFVYSGAPAKGSLVGVVAAANGTDPYGNIYGQGLTIGTWSAAGILQQHFSVDLNGLTYLVNGSGTLIQQQNPFDGSSRFYDASGQVAGHLAASISPVSGSDAAGNNYLPGVVSYNPGGGSIQLLTFEILFNQVGNLVPGIIAGSTPGVITMSSPEMSGGDVAASIALISALEATPSSAAQFLIDALVTGNLTIAPFHPGSNTPETWQAAVLGNGWTGSLRYRLRAENEVSLNGHIVAGTIVSGTVVATLPAAYRPASVEQRVALPIAPSNGGNPQFLIETTGAVEVAGLPAGTTDVWVNARFPLD